MAGTTLDDMYHRLKISTSLTMTAFIWTLILLIGYIIFLFSPTEFEI